MVKQVIVIQLFDFVMELTCSRDVREVNQVTWNGASIGIAEGNVACFLKLTVEKFLVGFAIGVFAVALDYY